MQLSMENSTATPYTISHPILNLPQGQLCIHAAVAVILFFIDYKYIYIVSWVSNRQTKTTNV